MAGVQEQEVFGQISEARSRLLNAQQAPPAGTDGDKSPEQKQAVINAAAAITVREALKVGVLFMPIPFKTWVRRCRTVGGRSADQERLSSSRNARMLSRTSPNALSERLARAPASASAASASACSASCRAKT